MAFAIIFHSLFDKILKICDSKFSGCRNYETNIEKKLEPNIEFGDLINVLLGRH